MCLIINLKNKKTLVPLKRKYAYKVVYIIGSYNEREFVSLYRHKVGEIGTIYKSNRRRKSLTAYERESECIYSGVHVYPTLSGARLHTYDSRVVIRVAVDPKDFVARSYYGQEAVYKKVLPVAFVK
jgi:hypothetical protein